MDRLTEEERSKLLLENAQLGWWEADFVRGIFTCSDFLIHLFGRKEKELSFAEFQQMIREDYRNRITSEFASVRNQEVYDQIFPIDTIYGVRWIRSKVCRRSESKEGVVTVMGFIQLLPERKLEKEYIHNKAQINDLLNHLGNLFRALSSFIQTKDLHYSIRKVLKEVLYSIDEKGRAYIMEYNKEAQTLSCIYEVCSGNVSSVQSLLQNIPLGRLPWSTGKIAGSHPIILNHLSDLPPEASAEKEYLSRRGALSAILIPLVAKERVMGYMGIDILNKPRVWSHEDYQWLSSTANMISIVSEMMKANEALDRSEKLLRNIYMNIPVGIELYDEKGFLQDINNKDIEIFGLSSKEEVIGINVFENPLIPEDIREKMKNREPVSFRLNYSFDSIRSNQYYNTGKKGFISLFTKVSMLYDNHGNLINYVFINLDNTDQTIAYNRLEEFEYFFNLVSRFAKVGYAKYDLYANEGYAISQWYRNLGEKEGTPLSQVIGIYKGVHPEDRKVIVDFFEKVKQGKAHSIRHELRVNAGNGEWKWIRVNVMRNMQDRDPLKLEMVCVNYDITELKEIQKQREKAEELDRLKSAFLANMSHEIRTPLNAIVGFSTLLSETDDSDEKMQFIDIIQKNNDLLLQLISDVLDLAKIESNTIEFTPVDIDLLDFCNELIASLRIKVADTVTLCCAPDLSPCTFYCDPVRLTQVISNFINNAIKYTSVGSITLNYEILPTEITFSVTDTGEGMPEEVRSRIFDRFYKGNTFKQGTGLGLSICKSIVEQLGGKIGVKSEIAHGSCFWFTLPR